MALVERAAAMHGQTADAFASDAIRRFAESEADWLAFLDAGIADLDAGRTITHDELIERIKARRSRSEAA